MLSGRVVPRRYPGLKPAKDLGYNRGRDDFGRPSLRTGLADFPHPALQLVVSFQEGRQAAACACFKEYKPTAEK